MRGEYQMNLEETGSEAVTWIHSAQDTVR